MLLMIKQQDGEYAYTYETDYVQWTPLNSNLQMQGIKVILSKKASYLSPTHNQQGSIDFNTANTDGSRGMYFLIQPQGMH